MPCHLAPRYTASSCPIHQVVPCFFLIRTEKNIYCCCFYLGKKKMDGTLIVSRKNQELIAKMKAQIRISSCNTLFPERYELTPSTNEIKRVKFDPESLFCIVTVLVKQEANNWSPVARAY